MQITETRVKLVDNRNDRLKAFCSITFDNDFVVRDLKIIEGTGGYFVAMPSRKLTDHCPGCGAKNHLRAHFCSECGKKLSENRVPDKGSKAPKLHADIAHPVNTQTRQYIQNTVVEAYKAELEKAKDPNYRPLADFDEDDYDTFHHTPAAPQPAPETPPSSSPPPDNTDDSFSRGIF